MKNPKSIFWDSASTTASRIKSEAVRMAINRLRQEQELETRRLQESAQLYAQIYEEDAQLRELTESAIVDWPL